MTDVLEVMMNSFRRREATLRCLIKRECGHAYTASLSANAIKCGCVCAGNAT